MMKRVTVILAVVSAGVRLAVAGEYVVSPHGDDTAEGSAARPWRTIQRAADVAVAGDVVTIRGGVYREWVNPVHAGRADAPIVYQAAKGERVVVTGADPVTGWTKRPDGLWEAKLRYDAFRGMNPFTDFIHGDWFGNGGRERFRTRLIQEGKPLELHERDALIGTEGGSKNPGQCLVNIAGVTAGGRTVPGKDATRRKGPEGGFTPKEGYDTQWGLELGWIEEGASFVMEGFDLTTPAARELAIHLSSMVHETEIEVSDVSDTGRPLVTVYAPVTGDWRTYTTVKARLPDSAAGMTRLLFRFRRHRQGGRILAEGHAVLIPGVVSGTIVAAFRQDPNTAVPELVTRPACFYPIETRRDHITLRGMIFRDAGPNWAPPTSEQTAIVGTNWSCGWIIEDCEVSGTECSGITLGKYGDAWDNAGPTAQNYHNTIMRCVSNGLDRVGHHLVRRCRITDCGQAGICGSLGAVFSTIEDCEIAYCHWKKPFGGAEMGGIKIHGAVDFTIARNRIHHCGSVAGIWFDWMGQGARVTGNTMWANACDLFFEVDHGPILVEGNDLLSGKAYMACSQGVAFVGNRIRGTYQYHNDARRTPVFKPHTVELDSLDRVACGNGAHLFINNILGNNPAFEKEAHPSRFEDNWMVPSACWKVDEATGACEIAPPEGAKRPDFKPVDADRLGKPPFVDQTFPAPSVSIVQSVS
ncbi:MAG: right-handed parallel beta-helix repeat-containing protein [Kiritimatiellae bacterium]|nr:right-handed parallel beta-helix repeat-containing protein [Kiritimatiellia bacterium]